WCEWGGDFRCGCRSTPLRFQGGWLRCAINKKIPFLSGADGAVSKRSRSLLYARLALHISFEINNRPVCASKERGLLIEAQPPRLGKAGNGPKLGLQFETSKLL